MENSTIFLDTPASSSSFGRTKVTLKPGRSLMDWMRFTNSTKNFNLTCGKIREISSRELAKHNKSNDMWIALKGKVYNITHYLEYHPGGEAELMRGAGKDATHLFNQVHQWVNVESMLQNCFVGILKKSWTREGEKENSDEVHNELKNVSLVYTEWSTIPLLESEFNQITLRCDEHEDSLKILINTHKYPELKQQGLVIDLIEKELLIKINSHSYFVNIALSPTYQNHFNVAIKDDSILEFLFKKQILDDLSSRNLVSKSCNSLKCRFSDKDKLIYWPCKLISKTPVNHNTFLFTFLLPPGTKMWIPIGYHVHIKCNINGIDVVRSYTPICSTLNPKINCSNNLDGSKLIMMIKIYPLGALTPTIKRCTIGESMYLSNFSGKFSLTFIENSDSIVMLAAGTGITSMIRIINWTVADTRVKRSLQLLFFNKTEDDILWRKELDDCKLEYNKLQINYILSEPTLEWTGCTGLVNKNILAQTIQMNSNQRYLICGPTPFAQTASSCLKEVFCSEEDIYVFTGS